LGLDFLTLPGILCRVPHCLLVPPFCLPGFPLCTPSFVFISFLRSWMQISCSLPADFCHLPVLFCRFLLPFPPRFCLPAAPASLLPGFPATVMPAATRSAWVVMPLSYPFAFHRWWSFYRHLLHAVHRFVSTCTTVYVCSVALHLPLCLHRISTTACLPARYLRSACVALLLLPLPACLPFLVPAACVSTRFRRAGGCLEFLPHLPARSHRLFSATACTSFVLDACAVLLDSPGTGICCLPHALPAVPGCLVSLILQHRSHVLCVTVWISRLTALDRSPFSACTACLPPAPGSPAAVPAC